MQRFEKIVLRVLLASPGTVLFIMSVSYLLGWLRVLCAYGSLCLSLGPWLVVLHLLRHRLIPPLHQKPWRGPHPPIASCTPTNLVQYWPQRRRHEHTQKIAIGRCTLVQVLYDENGFPDQWPTSRMTGMPFLHRVL